MTNTAGTVIMLTVLTVREGENPVMDIGSSGGLLHFCVLRCHPTIAYVIPRTGRQCYTIRVDFSRIGWGVQSLLLVVCTLPSPTQSVTPYQCQAGGVLSRYYISSLTTTPSVTAGIVIEL